MVPDVPNPDGGAAVGEDLPKGALQCHPRRRARISLFDDDRRRQAETVAARERTGDGPAARHHDGARRHDKRLVNEPLEH